MDEQLYGRRIGPLQVIQHDQDLADPGQVLRDGLEDPEPLPRRHRRPVTEFGHEQRQIPSQRAGRVQPGQHLEHHPERPVRRTAVILDGTPPGGEHTVRLGDRCQLVGQPGLADPRLTRHEYDLSSARAQPVGELVKLTAPPYELCPHDV